ncbi:hypothetical protein [Anaerosporobacter sp.]
MKNQKTTAKLKPFDNTLLDDLNMYDKMPYSSNYDLCNSNTVCLQSGNLLKFYRVNEKEPYIIKPDGKRLHVNTAPTKDLKEAEAPAIDSDDTDSLTAEQLESLLRDSDI